MKVKDLRELLKNVPDDFDVLIEDINFSGGKECDTIDFHVHSKEKTFLLPAVEQVYCD